MTSSLKKQLLRETVKRRQLEIEQCLAEHALTPGPHRLLPDVSSDDSHFRRLSAALVSLGPVFSSFGIYLASRVDLLTPKACLELAAIPDWAQPTPIEKVRELISREIGCPPAEVYSVFEEEPFETRLMFQSHRARLLNDKAVTVKVVRPEFEEQLDRDAKLLSLLKRAFAGQSRGDLPIDSAISDFRRTLERQLNFMNEAEALESLSHQAAEFGALRVPFAHRRFCAPKLLTIERLSGRSLSDLIAQIDDADCGQHWTSSEVNDVDLRDLANRLCLLWLRLALQGRLYPVEPSANNVLILSNNQIAFTGGGFASLASEAKVILLDYLVATSTRDTDKACSCLIKEMRKISGATTEEDLRHRVRQVVPFRDGGWGDSSSDSLAEHLFLHCRLASSLGYRPLLHLLCFFRGLFWIANSTRRLTRGRDALLEALEELRMNAVMSQFREMMSLPRLTDNADKYATMMMELPRKLDEALTLMAGGSTLLKIEGARIAGSPRQNSSPAVVVALLLLLAGVVVLSHHLLAAEVAGGWVKEISAVAFVLIGAMLLRAVVGSR